MNPQQGTIGVVITATVVDSNGVPINIAAATVKKLVVKQGENGPVVQWDAAFVTDGSDGKLKFTTTSADDLKNCGTYQVQALITTPTLDGMSTVGLFDVLKNL